jgi:hypothetical protein
MTAWTITLAPDDRTIHIDADEITTRPDGSLWLLRCDAPPPDKLATVLILARGQWRSAYPADTVQVPVTEPAPSWGVVREPHILAQAVIDDPLAH